MAEETHKFELHYTSGLIGGTQDEIPDVYKARSAIYHADSIRTPLLLMHGDQDNVVAPSQSRSMAKTIEQNGGCVRYIEYEGEGHGFRQVSTRCKALEAEFEFFQKAAHSVRSP
ncbi:alpha beta-hydrolase [Malassezia pachydermatis]|uniref:Alpha beta-hydrolase n=1 Tax=Malassezia pachydermatis TaxID=77020 RepID=A0A0M8MSF6_9BASI|nr:alpha beta-hydrolase [Malassezia pachydermatis]KOS15837.1 alpha beta-hydrolase [Malassezia pachydermatis]